MKPDPRVSKSGRTPEWYKETGKYYRNKCGLQSADRTRMLYLLGLSTGKLRETDYKYIVNPTNDKRKKNYPAKLVNYDIISPIVYQLIGEFISRNFDPLVICTNSDVHNTKQKFVMDGILQSTHQAFVNAMIQQGLFVEGQTDPNTGQPIQEPQHPDEIRKANKNIPDVKTIMGQRALGYVRSDQDLDSHFRRMWYQFIVTNRCVSYRAVERDNVKYYHCNVANFDYFGPPTEKYIERMEAQRYLADVTYSQLVDMFGESEDKEAKRMLDKLRTQEEGNNTPGFMEHFAKNFLHETDKVQSKGALFQLEHIQFTGLKKLVVLEVNGNKVYLDEDYIALPGEKTKTIWVNQKYEVYCVNDEFWVEGRELSTQRGDMDNPNVCNSNYGGVVFTLGDGIQQQSIIERLEQYQHAYNASKFKLQSLINKVRGKITTIPKGMLGFENEGDEEYTDEEGVTHRRQGWSLDRSLDLADAMGLLLLDETVENISSIVAAIKDINPADGQSIELIMRHCEQTKMEAEELVGFNRYRKAQTTSSDPVSNAQQGSYVGSLITEIYFREFNDCQEKESGAIIDLSKVAWIDGKRAMYMRSDGEQQLLEIIPEDYMESNYGVFIKNGGQEKQGFDIFKQLAQAFAQNQMKASLVGKLLQTGKNFAQITEELEEEEQAQAQQAQANQDQINQIEQSKIDQAERFHQDQMKLEQYKVDAPIEARFNELLANLDGEDGSIDYAKLQLELHKMQAQLKADFRKDQVELYKTDKKAETDKYKADKSLQVARTNPG